MASRHENLILEKYYAPVLDTPSYVSAQGHRWPASQRADAEARIGPGFMIYVSDAQDYPDSHLAEMVVLARLLPFFVGLVVARPSAALPAPRVWHLRRIHVATTSLPAWLLLRRSRSSARRPHCTGRRAADAELEKRARAIHERVITLDTHDDINPANFTAARNYTQDLRRRSTCPR